MVLIVETNLLGTEGAAPDEFHLQVLGLDLGEGELGRDAVFLQSLAKRRFSWMRRWTSWKSGSSMRQGTGTSIRSARGRSVMVCLGVFPSLRVLFVRL